MSSSCSSATDTGPMDENWSGLLSRMLKYFPKHESGQLTEEIKCVSQLCNELFERDYTCGYISNAGGSLCEHYPYQIPILEKTCHSEVFVNTTSQVADVINANSVPARCRRRFAVPVILLGNLNICRSATLSRSGEIFYRQTSDNISSIWTSSSKPTPVSSSTAAADTVSDSVYQATLTSPANSVSTYLVDKCRSADIALLDQLGVHYICDLMIEHRKLKYGVYVSSSEKADARGRYDRFSILTMPYPGVEWFNSMRVESYDPRNIIYDWSHPEVDAELNIPLGDSAFDSLLVDWGDYKKWSLVQLTQNYLKVLLQTVRKQKDEPVGHGLLVHCISGWDRTPLFVSLLRISLWADGKIHESLSAEEMLYLTIGYDWLLFGHQLPSRLNKGEEIFLFCFDFLQYITDDEYALDPDNVPLARHEASPSTSDDGDGVLKTPTFDQNVDIASANPALSALEEECLLDAFHETPSESSKTTSEELVTEAVVTQLEEATRRDSGEHAAAMPMPVPQQTSESEADSAQSVESNSSWQLVDEEQLTVSMNRPPPLLLDALFKQKPDTQAMRTTVRQQRLLRLRALFIPLYQDAVPSVAGAPRPWMEWVKSLIGHHY